MIAGQCRECGYLLVVIENDGLCRSQEPAGGEIGGGERLAQMLRIATQPQPSTITNLSQTKEQGGSNQLAKYNSHMTFRCRFGLPDMTPSWLSYEHP